MYFHPLYTLFRKGPLLNGFGFWGGKEDSEICSILTNVDSQIWIQNPNQCNILIQRQYDSFSVTLYTICFLCFIIKSFTFIYTYICIVRPITKAMETLGQNKLK